MIVLALIVLVAHPINVSHAQLVYHCMKLRNPLVFKVQFAQLLHHFLLLAIQHVFQVVPLECSEIPLNAFLLAPSEQFLF